MQLCELANETIAILSFRSDAFFNKRGNRLVGVVG